MVLVSFNVKPVSSMGVRKADELHGVRVVTPDTSRVPGKMN